MADEKRKIPVHKVGEYTVCSCGVCDIDGIIGSPEDECDMLYSAPDVEYDYGYDFVKLTGDGCIRAYYIGKDRFYPRDGSYGKEYMLYELAVYLGESEVFGHLYRHLCELARVTGCERILLCDTVTGELYRLLTADGFVRRDGMLVKRLEGVTLPERDRLVIPTDSDALTQGELFFLREQGFVLDGEKCRFEIDEKFIEIDRSRGACHFSDGFSVIGGELMLGTEHALCIIDVCVQLMKIRINEDIVINLAASVDEGRPDISFGRRGISYGRTAIFLPEARLTLKEKNALRAHLRAEGKYDSYELYHFWYDYEVGGSRTVIAFAKL